jgi:hypothetical protein
VGIGETHAFARELIDVRRRDFRAGMVARDIAVAEVIGKDEEDVGSIRLDETC